MLLRIRVELERIEKNRDLEFLLIPLRHTSNNPQGGLLGGRSPVWPVGEQPLPIQMMPHGQLTSFAC